MTLSIQALTERLSEAKVDHKKDVAMDRLSDAFKNKWEPDRVKISPLEQEGTKKESISDYTRPTAGTKASVGTGQAKRT
jgi:hypothetical protein